MKISTISVRSSASAKRLTNSFCVKPLSLCWSYFSYRNLSLLLGSTALRRNSIALASSYETSPDLSVSAWINSSCALVRTSLDTGLAKISSFEGRFTECVCPLPLSSTLGETVMMPLSDCAVFCFFAQQSPMRSHAATPRGRSTAQAAVRVRVKSRLTPASPAFFHPPPLHHSTPRTTTQRSFKERTK